MNRKLFNAQISQYATPTVSGEGSVILENNIRCYLPEMQVDGATTQGSFAGTAVKTISLSTFTETEIQFTDFDTLIFSTKSIAMPNASSVLGKLVLKGTNFDTPDGIRICVTDGNYVANLYASGAGLIEQNIKSSIPGDKFYIGVLDQSKTMTESELKEIYDLVITNYNLQLSYYAESSTPAPETPIPIQNANGIDTTTNLFTTENSVTGTVGTTGTVDTNGNYRTTDFIEVVGNQKYRLKYTNNRAYSNSWIVSRVVWCYDENKTTLKCLYCACPTKTGEQDIILNIPQNAKYIRFSWFATTSQPYDTNISITKFIGVSVHGKNLALATECYSIGAKYELVEVEDEITGQIRKCAYFQCVTAKYANGSFKDNTQYTVSFYAKRAKAVNTEWAQPFCFWYTDGTYQMVGGTTNVQNQFTKVTGTSTTGKTVAYIGVYNWNSNVYAYVDIDTFQLEEGTVATEYEPYFREEITIPTSVDINGKTVPLLMSAYDKLAVDRLANKVIYTEGSFKYSYTGNEKNAGMQIANGNGLNYQSFLEYVSAEGTGGFVNNIGYCTHFKKAGWNPLSAYGTYATRTYDVIFRTDGKQTLDEFKAYLQEQYANGTPVTIIKQRTKPIERDITNTDLGQQLLLLATQNGTNYLEITSNLAPTLTVKYLTHS